MLEKKWSFAKRVTKQLRNTRPCSHMLYSETFQLRSSCDSWYAVSIKSYISRALLYLSTSMLPVHFEIRNTLSRMRAVICVHFSLKCIKNAGKRSLLICITSCTVEKLSAENLWETKSPQDWKSGRVRARNKEKLQSPYLILRPARRRNTRARCHPLT